MLRELVNTSETQRIDAAKLRTDGGTQMRAQLDDSTVFEYTQAMIAANGWGTFPNVVAYYDGSTYWLGDGFHRVQAYRDAFPGSSEGVPVEVRSGTRRDAILHAAGANASHGLRRTNADKQRAVETLLRDNEWSQWSNAEIARRCAVDEKTVRNMRSKLEATSELPKSDVRKGADGRTINTASIGKAKPASAPAPRPVSPEQRQYDMAAVSVTVPQPLAPKAAPAAVFEMVAGDIPVELLQRGWALKQVPGSGRYYCHNAKGPRATGVFDKAADAIQAAYDMQVDLAWEAAQQLAAPAAVEVVEQPQELPQPSEIVAALYRKYTSDSAEDKDEAKAFWQAAGAIESAMKMLALADGYLYEYHDDMRAEMAEIVEQLHRMLGDLL